MKKITFSELRKAFQEFNQSHNNGADREYITGVIVYKASNWDKEYTETERSYRVASNNNAFKSGKISTSIYANCLDGKDIGVRLDWYDEWEIDYCYLDEEALETI